MSGVNKSRVGSPFSIGLDGVSNPKGSITAGGMGSVKVGLGFIVGSFVTGRPKFSGKSGISSMDEMLFRLPLVLLLSEAVYL